MYSYQERDNLIYQLHPATMIVFVMAIFILAMVFSHPVYLLGLLLAVGIVIVASGNFGNWKTYLRFCLMMALFIILINALFSPAGTTVLLELQVIPGFYSIQVTKEALAYGMGMSIRLMIIISVFCLYTYVINPDKILGILGRFGNKSVLVISLCTRLFPLMIEDYKRIAEVQRCRGVNYQSAKWWDRIRNLLPVCSVLLLSSLERSMQQAESLYARAYGSGSRTCYNREIWRLRDYLTLIVIVIAMLAGVWTAWMGWSTYNYYPKLNEFLINETVTAFILSLAFTVPAILNWGWMKWPTLRSKI
ncbi:MAG: energy-coupling factor transporter transmembrane component T [Bacillota bacterium]|nr:energy-coupling factor transporter transmembrane component T [Bacillota bacterium]